MNKKLLLFAMFGVVLSMSIFTYAIFSGSHTVYENKTTAANFCTKCHSTKVTIVAASAHADAGCICHGYNPNITDPIKSINVAHNLTKNIYCTNCHSNYTDGDITIHVDAGKHISGINQSAHYITNNTWILYNHSKQFFANRT